MAQGRVHRLESLNTYMACRCEGHEAAPVLSICGACGSVAETISAEVMGKLQGVARKTGFSPTRHVIEVHGVCASCEVEEGRA